MKSSHNTVDPAKDDYFENFCVACDDFRTPDGPFATIVGEHTKWKNIGCKSFWD